MIDLPTRHEKAAMVARAWVGRHSGAVSALRRDGGMRACVDASQVAATGAQGLGGLQAFGGQRQ